MGNGGGAGGGAGAARLRRGGGGAGRQPRPRRPRTTSARCAGCRPSAPSTRTRTARSRPARSTRPPESLASLDADGDGRAVGGRAAASPPGRRHRRSGADAAGGDGRVHGDGRRRGRRPRSGAELAAQFQSIVSRADADGDGSATGAEILALMTAEAEEPGGRGQREVGGREAGPPGAGGGRPPQPAIPLMPHSTPIGTARFPRWSWKRRCRRYAGSTPTATASSHRPSSGPRTTTSAASRHNFRVRTWPYGHIVNDLPAAHTRTFGCGTALGRLRPTRRDTAGRRRSPSALCTACGNTLPDLARASGPTWTRS